MSPLHLDLQTLSFVLVLVTAFLIFVTSFVWLTQKTYTGFGMWVISSFAVAGGIFLLGFEGAAADILGTSLTFSAVLIGYEGNRRFLNLKNTPFLSLGIFCIQLAGLIFFKFFADDDIISQISFTSFLVAVISFYSGLLFINSPSQPIRFSHLFTGGTYFVFAACMGARAVITVFTGDKNDFYKPDGIQPMFFILYILFEIIWTFNYINLNADRLHNELKQTQTELEKMATTDFLTGVNNNRKFLEIGENELKRAERFRTPFSVIMFDLDFFKSINDQYGHAAGDQVLIEVAETCRKLLRVTDTFGRLGGEEFAILLPYTKIDDAVIVAEYLRAAFEEKEINFSDKIIKITASFGVTELQNSDTRIKIILDRTDTLLYKSKNKGRNCVTADSKKTVYEELAAA